MRQSFVGIIDSSGLTSLLCENDRIIECLLQLAQRRKGVCFWAVVDDAVAWQIRRELDEGNRIEALHALRCHASELGQILPSPSVPIDESVVEVDS